VDSTKTGSACVRVVLSTMMLAGSVSAAAAQTRDWANLTLEQLMTIEITSVSRKPQSLASAPAAVFVISEQDIRRSGASSIPELLRLAPGVQVARYSNSKWSISARGMGSYYSSKLLVLVDGRSVLAPDFSGVFWDHLDLPLDDIERIEVVRGPGGTMWGANAVNGVVNIITKSAARTQGKLAVISGGSADPAVASVRIGDTIAGTWAYRAYGKGSMRRFDGSTFSRDSVEHARTGFRLDRDGSRDSVSFQGDLFTQQGRMPLTVPDLASPYSRIIDDHVHSTGVSLSGRWNRQLSATNSVALKSYFDRTARDEFMHGYANSRTMDVDFQQQLRLRRRHDFIWGTEYRKTLTQIGETALMRYDPGNTNRDLFSTFAQDEVTLPANTAVTLGAKIEHFEQVGSAFSPNARVMWTPAQNQRLWGAVSQAVRTPPLADQMATFAYTVVPPSAATRGLPAAIYVAGDPTRQRLETVVGYEVGYRTQPLPLVSFDVTAFRNDYTHLSSYNREPATLRFDHGIPYLYIRSVHENRIAGESHGLETTATWTPTARWSLSGSTTLLRTNLHVTAPDIEAGASLLVLLMSPEVQWTGRSSLQLLRNVEVDAAIYRVGAWRMGDVDAYSRVDARAGWTVTPVMTIDAGVQNIFSDRHRETSLYVYHTPTDIPRSGSVTLSLRF
jgi:iron complex outermembrane recepter protein